MVFARCETGQQTWFYYDHRLVLNSDTAMSRCGRANGRWTALRRGDPGVEDAINEQNLERSTEYLRRRGLL